jgi:hypothetical protein
MDQPRYVRAPWPDAVAPPGAPVWLFYELDEKADIVRRTIELFADGSATRNSIEIEERNGEPCPSLVDCSLKEAFGDAPITQISSDEFEQVWARATDEPYWNVG